MYCNKWSVIYIATLLIVYNPLHNITDVFCLLQIRQQVSLHGGRHVSTEVPQGQTAIYPTQEWTQKDFTPSLFFFIYAFAV